MTTYLKRFQDAYATVTAATYEPLILNWVSTCTLTTIANVAAKQSMKVDPSMLRVMPTALAFNMSARTTRLPDDIQVNDTVLNAMKIDPGIVTLNSAGNRIERNARMIHIEGYPNAVQVGDKIHLHGITNANGDIGVHSFPTLINTRGTTPKEEQPDFHVFRAKLFHDLRKTIRSGVENGEKLEPIVEEVMKNSGLLAFNPIKIEEALSPIGIAHFFRQLFFHKEEGVGPIEQAFTIAPLETLEVAHETVHHQIHEEEMEFGSEEVSQQAQETKQTDELSEKVSQMNQRDTSAAISLSAGYSTPVWSGGGSASFDMKSSSQRSREQTSRRLKEVTTSSSQRITKTFKLRTREVNELTTTATTRRTIKNEKDHPVSYGLRRVLRKAHVKVQYMGPRLVWQLYIREPGAGLARSRFVHFREAEKIAPPDLPPGMREMPKGGTDTGQAQVSLENRSDGWYATLNIPVPPDRIIKSVVIDSVVDLEGGGKDDKAPAPINGQGLPAGNYDPNTRIYSISLKVKPGDSRAIQVDYTYTYGPSPAVIEEWETERKKRVQQLTQELLEKQFERQKQLITEKSKIRPRPSANLRREERYEVLNRMVSTLYGRETENTSEISPLMIEYFHRYFDIEGMFTYTHPSWWKPRYTPRNTALPRESYEITAESEPAPMGSSLGWLIQLDGDTRRNEFLNSPWVRVCVPFRPNREGEAIEWLAKHVEGDIGYDINSGPLSDLLADIEKIREEEASLGIEGPEYVKIDSDVYDDDPRDAPLSPERVYPIVDEYGVTVPTEGFVYDELILEN